MKHFFIIVILAFLHVNIVGQIAFHDALKLQNYCQLDTSDNRIVINVAHSAVPPIISHYAPGGKFDFSDNPFVKLGAEPQFIKPEDLDYPNLLSGVFGLDVSNLSRGLSLFLIDRAKQELNAAFFNRLKNHFKNYHELTALFPKTTKSLSTLVSNHYSEMLPALRVSFHEDLKHIPVNFDEVLSLPKYREFLNELPEIRLVIRSLRLANKIDDGSMNPAEIITSLSRFPEWEEDFNPDKPYIKNFGVSIKLAEIFSASLRSDDSNRVWITAKQFEAMNSDRVHFQIYLGLIYQQIKNGDLLFYTVKEELGIITPGEEVPITDLLVNKTDIIFSIQNQLSKFIDLAQRVDKSIGQIREHSGENGSKPSADELYQYYNTAIDIVDFSVEVTNAIKPNNIDIDTPLKLLRTATDIYLNCSLENYTAAISDVVVVLEEINKLFNEKNSDVIRSKKDLTESLKVEEKKLKKDGKKKEEISNNATVSDFKKKIALTDSTARYIESFDNSIKFIRKYGLFIANVVEAEDAEGVKAAIESAVLPVGSSAIKKNSSWNISVQANLGAMFAFNTPSTMTNAWDAPLRLTAPIGISFNTGFRKGGSLGLNLVVLDVGAIVDYELSMDTVSTTNGNGSASVDYSIKLGQIFSPGAFLSYGLPCNIPIALSFGAQYGPGLARIESGGSTIVQSGWRYGITLTVDIPLFTVFNREMMKYK